MSESEREIRLLLERTEDVDDMLSSNPLWDDVTPLPQNDGPNTGKLEFYCCFCFQGRTDSSPINDHQ